MSYTIHTVSKFLFLILQLLLLLIASPVSAAADKNTITNAAEYKLKAAYIYNIAKFVQWPQQAFSTEDAPLNIAIYGDVPFAQYIHILNGKKIGQHPIQLSRINDLSDIDQFQILYISKSEASEMEAISSELRGKRILTISDMDHFLTMGGVLRLYTAMNRLIITINMQNARHHQLQFSAKLLEIASLIELVPE